MKKLNNKGFTLIEVLAVVVILSVLFGVLGSFIIYDKLLNNNTNVEDKASGSDKDSNENTNVANK